MTGLVGLLKIELPDRDVRLCDGGFITFNSELYTSIDSVLGSIASIDSMDEGGDGAIPALDFSFSPPGPVAISALTAGALQRSDVYLWLAEYDVATNLVVGTPDLLFIGQLDQPSIRASATEYNISISCVSKAEWFFERDIGNGLSATFHKEIYPGETGHDNAAGLVVRQAWGTESPPAAGGYRGGGNGGAPIPRQLS